MAWRRTTETGDAAPAASLLKSRIGRRVLTLFVVSALIPLGLCAVMLYRAFDAELSRAQAHSLDGDVRSFGMTVFARLGGADDVLRGIIRLPGATDEAVQERVARLPWVRRVRSVRPDQDFRGQAAGLPQPSGKQQQALAAGAPVLLWQLDGAGRPQVLLVRRLPSGAWLYAEVAPSWLWAAADEFAADAGLQVFGPHGREVFAAGQRPPAPAASGWLHRSWELFLGSRFSSPSWRLEAMAPRVSLLDGRGNAYPVFAGFIVLTFLLIAWLSMNSIRRQLRPLGQLTQATRRVAQRDFEAFQGMAWGDEFGDLAASFDTMAQHLKRQFSALETLAEVDRLLLHAPELELILDALLPRIAGILACDSVSVILFDPDSDTHARAYDFFAHEPGRLPVRRIRADRAALGAVCAQSPPPLVDAAAAVGLAGLLPQATPGIQTLRLQPLQHGAHFAGVLCIGSAGDRGDRGDSAIGIVDFADRLSLILANLEQSARLYRQAHFDALTGLQNRYVFAGRVRAAVDSAVQAQGMGSLLYLDLDHFKRVNDTAGHTAGDCLLRIVGERLTAGADADQSVARLGGDEFAVLLPCIADPDSVRQRVDRLLADLQRPYLIDGREHHVSASIGITVFPADGTSLEELLKAGDIAMYQAKEAGRGRAVYFQAAMQRSLLERVSLEADIHRAWAQQAFRLHYQPIVSCAADGAVGVEALLRWPGQGAAPWVPPHVFVPVAEETGLIVQLGEWVLRRACAQFARWRAEGTRLSYLSVNVSVRQLREPGYLATLGAALSDSGMDGRQLQLEITESVLAQGGELAATLSDIVGLGVRLALDDFGTGYSSLSYLRAYPIHTVKIDRAFVTGLPDEPAACRLAESILAMCAALGKQVVAEGVETPAQLEFLRRAGCTSIQGFLLGRPMDPADIPGFTRELRAKVAAASPAPALMPAPMPA
ncbi:MAG: EAL domain-containing protein [Burkholderiales bacterium]|nr:EAL domain-containing protein [Burkholderiales bacterium]